MAPKTENTPGITWRKTKLGWEARWRARADLVKRGFKPRVVRLWASEQNEIEPDEFSVAFIQDRCNALQSEMLVWGRGGLPPEAFDGTIRTLARCYQTDPDSDYHKGRYNTRGYYDTLCRMIVEYWGDKQLQEIKLRDVIRWHQHYLDQGKIAMGHSLIGMLRTLVGFGARLLEIPECVRLQGVLKQRFKMPKPRTSMLTAGMVVAIRREAHKAGRPSIALAQALQFEMGAGIRQKDVIGEWVPISEPGISAVTNGNMKWLRGLDWKEIDANWICTHITSKRQKEITVALTLAPMVVEEWNGRGRDVFPASGPVITDEKTGLPYTAQDFRKAWRRIATDAGVPRGIRNMDTRAGAISEATDSGAPLEKVRKAATHSDIGMTQKYSRGDAEATAEVMQLRVAHRNKPKNG